MSLILDAFVILIIFIFIFLSAKKGFVRTLIEVVGFVAAIAIAFSLSTPVAGFIYDKTIDPAVDKTIQSAVDEGNESVNTAVDALWNKMPGFLTGSNFFNLSKDNVLESVNNGVSANATELSHTISNNFLKPVVTRTISTLISVILVFALLLLVKFLAKHINKLFNISVVGKINKTLGAILGIFKGVSIAIVFCMVISLILSFTKNGFLFFTYDAIESSYIFKFLIGLSPFYN